AVFGCVETLLAVHILHDFADAAADSCREISCGNDRFAGGRAWAAAAIGKDNFHFYGFCHDSLRVIYPLNILAMFRPWPRAFSPYHGLPQLCIERTELMHTVLCSPTDIRMGRRSAC